jgi:hypothetical protein
MPKIEAQSVESTRRNRAFGDLIANPLPLVVLMTSSSELP